MNYPLVRPGSTDAVAEGLSAADRTTVFAAQWAAGRLRAQKLATFYPRSLAGALVLALAESMLWTLAWSSGVARAATTASLAYHLGLLAETVRLLTDASAPPHQGLYRLPAAPPIRCHQNPRDQEM